MHKTMWICCPTGNELITKVQPRFSYLGFFISSSNNFTLSLKHSLQKSPSRVKTETRSCMSKVWHDLTDFNLR